MSEEKETEGNKGGQPGASKAGGRKSQSASPASKSGKQVAKSGSASQPPVDKPKASGQGRAPTSTPASQSHPPAGGRERHQGRGLALLALLIAVIAFGSSGYLWHQFDQAQSQAAADSRLQSVLDQAQKNADAVAAVESSVDKRLQELTAEQQKAAEGLSAKLGETQQQLEAAQKSAEQSLVTRVENLQLAQRGLNESLETIREAVASGGDSNAWTLSEVGYLLQIAEHRLRFQEDPHGALAALMLARQRLGAVGELAFNPVLLLLDEEIATLRGVDKIDRTEIATKIAGLAQEVTELPVRNDMRTEAIKAKAAAERESLKDGAAEEAQSGEGWVESVAEKAWGEVKNLVVVRHERRSAPPLIAPEEGYFLAENLRLKLEAARLALLLGDGAIYHESLTMAQDWVDSYFEPTNEKVIAAKNEIKALQRVELHPYLPDISKARRAFQDVMDHRQPLRPLANEGQPAQTSEPAAEGQG